MITKRRMTRTGWIRLVCSKVTRASKTIENSKLHLEYKKCRNNPLKKFKKLGFQSQKIKVFHWKG